MICVFGLDRDRLSVHLSDVARDYVIDLVTKS